MTSPIEDLHLSEELADDAISADLASMSSVAVDEIVSVLVDSLVASVRGWDHPIVDTICGVLTATASPPQATLLGRGLKIGATYAAMVNATAARARSTAFSKDAMALVIVPAVLAASELDVAAPGHFVEGVAVGLHGAARLADVLSEAHINQGWDLLGTAARVGAALGVSRLFQLSRDQTIAALGFASTQAAGFIGTEPSAIAPLVAGKASADGLEAGLLARAGLIGPALPLEGRRGLLALESRTLNERLEPRSPRTDGPLAPQTTRPSSKDGTSPTIERDHRATMADAILSADSINALLVAVHQLADAPSKGSERHHGSGR